MGCILVIVPFEMVATSICVIIGLHWLLRRICVENRKVRCCSSGLELPHAKRILSHSAKNSARLSP